MPSTVAIRTSVSSRVPSPFLPSPRTGRSVRTAAVCVASVGMDVFEAMRTTRAMRRLDNDRPVPEEDIWSIVEMATKAATGGNSQPVRWIVVTDADKRRRLGQIYKDCWAQVGAMYRQRTPS